MSEYSSIKLGFSTKMQYVFKLPDAVKGKSNLVIRLRVNSQERATLNGSNIGTSGTNRLGFVRITQMKN